MLKTADRKESMGIIYLDFLKAAEKVSHRRLLKPGGLVTNYGVKGEVLS